MKKIAIYALLTVFLLTSAAGISEPLKKIFKRQPITRCCKIKSPAIWTNNRVFMGFILLM